MTTFEPGASVVLTHGLLDRPRSTAFLASRAAATITDGFEVFVHEVMAAITTAPWSTSQAVPSSSVTEVGRLGRPSAPSAALGTGRGAPPSSACEVDGGSLAGNDSSPASSTGDGPPAPA